jgi:hypothetical protein
MNTMLRPSGDQVGQAFLTSTYGDEVPGTTTTGAVPSAFITEISLTPVELRLSKTILLPSGDQDPRKPSDTRVIELPSGFTE